MISKSDIHDRMKRQDINPSLDAIREVTKSLGSPQNTFVSIRITGTNGKTSTAYMIDALLRAEDQSCGLFISPGLYNPDGDIFVDGEMQACGSLEARSTALCETEHHLQIELTSYEALTIKSILAFKDAAVDFAVIESGLGATWDATGIVNPAVAVVTGIGLDHCDFLGKTIEEIATNKSHIIVPGSSVILGESTQNTIDIFLQRAASFNLHPRQVNADSYHIVETTPFSTIFDVMTTHEHYCDLKLAAPAYQASNAATAIFAAEAVLGRALDSDKVRSALAHTTFPGRLEVIRKDPLLIFDGSHNPAAAHILAELIGDITQAVTDGAKPVIALGILADKDAEGIIKALAPVAADFIAIEPPNERAIPAAELAKLIEGVAGKPPIAIIEGAAVGEGGGCSANSAIEGQGINLDIRYEDCAEYPSPDMRRTGMDTLRQILNTTGRQPVIVTGSLSLYPLLQSIRLSDSDDVVGVT